MQNLQCFENGTFKREKTQLSYENIAGYPYYRWGGGFIYDHITN